MKINFRNYAKKSFKPSLVQVPIENLICLGRISPEIRWFVRLKYPSISACRRRGKNQFVINEIFYTTPYAGSRDSMQKQFSGFGLESVNRSFVFLSPLSFSSVDTVSSARTRRKHTINSVKHRGSREAINCPWTQRRIKGLP